MSNLAKFLVISSTQTVPTAQLGMLFLYDSPNFADTKVK
jgi:hypothetical protein